MMILRSSPPSPFGRKVSIALSLLGLDNEVKIEPADTTDANGGRIRSARFRR
jgi:glutathione S-transferase